MPWIAVVCLCLVGGCFFEAEYSGGTIYCSAGKCPSGLVCADDRNPPLCIEPRRDAAVDTMSDVMIDAREAALLCGDPGVLPAAGGMAMGSTMGRTNSVAPSCGGSVHVGANAVYRLDVASGTQLTLGVTADFTATAYVVQPCASNMGCVGNTYAFANNPATVTVGASGPPFIVVDSTFASSAGNYTLTVTVN